MKFIIPALCCSLATFVARWVVEYMSISQADEKGKVQLPKAFAIVGSITSVFFLIIAVITYLEKEPLWVNLFFIFAALLGIVLLMAFVNYRITYDDDGFVYRNFWGIKREFTYSQITGIKENVSECCIYIGKRKVTVECLSVGGIMFAAIIKKKYSDFHGGQKIPQVKPKHDIFNGHVKDAAGFVVAYGIMVIFTTAFLIFTICVVCLPKTESNTTVQKVTFISYEEVNEEIVLTSADGKMFKIIYTGEQFNGEKIKEICNGDLTVITYCNEVNPEDAEDYFSLNAIKYEDDYILSFDETNRLQREENFPLLIIAIVFVLAVWGLIIATIIVGRNPQKYSERVVKGLFKEGYINY